LLLSICLLRFICRVSFRSETAATLSFRKAGIGKMQELSGKRISDRSPHVNDSTTGNTLGREADSDQQPRCNNTAAIDGAAASEGVAEAAVTPAADSAPNTSAGTAANESVNAPSSGASSREGTSAAEHGGETAVSSDSESTSTSGETLHSSDDEETTEANMQSGSRPGPLVEEANKLLRGILSQAIEQMAANPAASLQTQANVAPETALHWLTA
jgi:hypothetical protein